MWGYFQSIKHATKCHYPQKKNYIIFLKDIYIHKLSVSAAE